MTKTNSKQIETAARIMAKAIVKLRKLDPEMAARVSAAVTAAVHG